jgi:hypothetical protein
MGRSRYNLGRRVPAHYMNPPNKALNPEWWEDESNLMRLHPSYQERKNVEKKREQKKSNR